MFLRLTPRSGLKCLLWHAFGPLSLAFSQTLALPLAPSPCALADDGTAYTLSGKGAASAGYTATVAAPPPPSPLNIQLSVAPALTFLLKKADGSSIGSKVQVNQTIVLPGGFPAGWLSTVNEGTIGHFPPRTYPIRLVGDAAKGVGDRLETFTVSQDIDFIYQTSRQTWTVALNGYASAPVPPASFTPLTGYQVDVYQCDSQGVVAWSGPMQPAFEDPKILTVTGTVGANAASVTFSTELFKGTYRAVFIPKAGSEIAEGVPFFLSGPFTAAGGGVTSESQTLSLPGPGQANRFALKLSPRAGAFAAGDFSVELRDKASLLRVAYGKIKADGTVAFRTHLADVIAVVTNHRPGSPGNGNVLAVHAYTGLTPSTPMAILAQHNVKGRVTGPIPVPDTVRVIFNLRSGLNGANWDLNLGNYLGFSAGTTSGSSFDVDLFEGDWSVKADLSTLPKFPDGPTVAFTLNADKADADIVIPSGGFITGTLRTKAGAPVSDTHVDLLDPSTLQRVKSTLTDPNGRYIFYVPFGTTYNLVVNADAYVSRPLTATSGSPTVIQDLVQHALQGRITGAGQGVSAGIHAGLSQAATAPDGTFTVNLFEGSNCVWIEPQDKSSNLGPVVLTNVLVDATAP